jgi:hypothetical protein
MKPIAIAIPFLFASQVSAQQVPIDRQGYNFEVSEWLERDDRGKPNSKANQYAGTLLLKGQAAQTLPNIQMELRGTNGEIIRLGDNTHFSLLNDRQVRLKKGNALLYIPPGGNAFRVHGPSNVLTLHRSGTVLLQATTNGGLKVIALHGNLHMELPTGSEEMEPGKLYFVLPQSSMLGKQLHINLPLLLKTSSLWTDFPPSIPTKRKIEATAFRQSFFTTRKTPLFVGDAKSSGDFDLLLVKP